jgi:polyphenol oxidase
MFKLEEFAGRRVLTSSLLEDEGLIAFFTTRDLPLKTGERADLIEEVENNKRLVCQELGIGQENLIIPQQTHSDNVFIAKCKMQNAKCYENTDALITNEQNTALALNFADCVPILFYDSIQKVVAATHAGWRGTAAQIAPKTVQKMVEEFSCKPSDIIAAIGPAIGKCCFEVKGDVLAQLAQSINTLSAVGVETPTYCRDSNIISDNHADLKLINKLQLLACGLEKIDVCEYCTSCQNELFFSYRREQGNTARHSAVIMVNSKR